jgi:glycosyltransferase involved in cell wall biosynthesis
VKSSKRILVLVPNGATTDNRVVREAESLQSAGHEILLVGLRLPALPGGEALTPKGVRVKRIDWRYRAFSQIAILYAAILLPLLAIVAITAGILAWSFYNDFVAPTAALIIDSFIDLIRLGSNSAYKLIASDEAPLFSGSYTISDIAEGHLFGYHMVVVAILYLLYLVLRRPSFRLGRALSGLGRKIVDNPAVAVVRQRARFARNYGETENIQQFNLLEALLAPADTPQAGLRNRISDYFIRKSRTSGFVAIGREFCPDIVHCHEIGSLRAGVILKKELGCKVLYEAHEIYDDLANASRHMSTVHQRIHQDCLPHVDAFITVNEAIASYYSHTYSALPAPVVMPNSVYPKNVTYDGRLHEAAKLPPQAKIMLYQGGFSPHRGLPILVEAAFNLPEEWYVVFMGRGPLKEHLEKLAEGFMQDQRGRILRGLSLESLAENERIEKLTATVHGVSPETGQQVVKQVALEELALAQAIAGAESGLLRGDIIERTVTEIREAEAKLSAERNVRRSMDQLRASRVLQKVRFVPMAPHSELVEWTSGAAVGIIPYENIGMNHWLCSPNKIWEYPNAGVPILASRLEYLTRVITTWGIGWTISSDPTVEDIVAAVRAITDDALNDKRAACRRFIQADNYTLHEPRLLGLVAGLAA